MNSDGMDERYSGWVPDWRALNRKLKSMEWGALEGVETCSDAIFAFLDSVCLTQVYLYFCDFL